MINLLPLLLLAATQPEIFFQNGHTSLVGAIWFSSDGQTIYTTADNELKVWSGTTGMLLDDVKITTNPQHIEMDGKSVKLIGYGGIERFDTTTHTVEVIEKKEPEMKFTDSPDGKIRVWESREGKNVSLRDRHSGVETPFSWIPELHDWVADNLGVYIAQRVSLEYLPFKGGLPRQLIRKTVAWIDKLALSGDQKLLAVGCRRDGVQIYDTTTGSRVRTLDRPGEVNAMRFSPDNKRLALGQSGIGVEIIDLESGETIFTLRQHSFPVDSVQFSRDGGMLLSRAAHYGAVLWNVANGRLEARLDTYASHLMFSPDGREIAYLNQASQLVRLDARSRHVIQTYPEPVSGFVTELRYSPDGQSVLVVTMHENAYVWSVSGGAAFKTSEQHVAAAFVGDALLVANEKGARSYDLKTGKARGAMRAFQLKRGPNDSALVFDKQGQTVLVKTDSGFAVVDLKTGKAVRKLARDADTCSYWSTCDDTLPVSPFTGSFDKSPDGRLLAYAGSDSRVRIVDRATSQELVSMVAFDGTEFVSFTPDNYYVASRGALSLVTFRANGKIFPFEQFDLRLNRPDIVMQRLGYASNDAVRVMKHAYDKRLKKMGFTEDMVGADFHLPELKIVSRRVEGANMVLQLQASDSKYKLERLHVLVNGVPLRGMRGVEATALQQTVPLQDGRNHIQVSVLNAQGVESLKDAVIHYHKGGRGQRFVVAIGVSKYANKDYDLRYAAKDARDVAAALQGQALTLLDADATKEKIAATRATLMKTQADDEVVVFVAGHGLLDDQLDYYFATHDIDFDKPAGRGLPYEDIEGLLDGIPARKKLLLMDTCHSGEVDKDSVTLGDNVVVASNFRGIKKQRLVSDDIQSLFTDLRRSSGAMVMSSASGVEYALESGELKNGVFTFAFLDALKRGVRKMSALRTYLSDKVLELTQGQQHPTVRRDNLELDFAL